MNVTKMAVLSSVVGAVAATIGAVAPAGAALTLTLNEPGYATTTITDTLNTGAVSFFGTYGDFQTNFVAGLSNKLTVGAPNATLQVQSINVKNLSTAGTTKTLTITLTDDGFTTPGTTGSTVSLDSSFGGSMTGSTAGDAVTFQSFVASPATTTGLQAYTIPTNNPGTTSFATNVTPVPFVRPAAFTLTDTTTVSLTGAFEQVNLAGTSTVTAVPEPTALAGLAAVGMAVAGRRSRRR